MVKCRINEHAILVPGTAHESAVASGKSLEESAGAENHDTPSIGGFVAILPLLLAAADSTTALADAQRHLQYTHKSARLAASLEVYAGVLWAVLEGAPLQEAALEGARHLGWDLKRIAAQGLADQDVVMDVLGPACYIGDSLPVCALTMCIPLTA